MRVDHATQIVKGKDAMRSQLAPVFSISERGFIMAKKRAMTQGAAKFEADVLDRWTKLFAAFEATPNSV